MRFNAEAAFAEIAGHLRLGAQFCRRSREDRKKRVENTASPSTCSGRTGRTKTREKFSFVLSPVEARTVPGERNPMPKLEIIDPGWSSVRTTPSRRQCGRATCSSFPDSLRPTIRKRRCSKGDIVARPDRYSEDQSHPYSGGRKLRRHCPKRGLHHTTEGYRGTADVRRNISVTGFPRLPVSWRKSCCDQMR